MKIIQTAFDAVHLLEPRVFRDARGWFVESWNRQTFASCGIVVDFVQDNHSRSGSRTLRGLHYQLPPRAQAKLVRCTVGRIWDLVLDIRRGSPTFGKWDAVELDAESCRMLYIPVGFAHGFCALSDTVEVQYKCSDYYAPELARGIRWNDAALGIPWPVGDPVLSEQDCRHPVLADQPDLL